MHKTIATFMFFTRLPLWRVWRDIPADCFSRVVELWPLVGWLTGGVMAAVLWGASLVLPLPVAALLAIAARMLLTGALHEDGLADFFDGFGAGGGRERILAIMKDSHIGTYGVLSLIVHTLLLGAILTSMPVATACAVILAADAWSKFCAAQIINFLPYARPVEQAKNRTVYQRFTPLAWIVALVIALVPTAIILILQSLNHAVVFFPVEMTAALAAPIIVTAFLIPFLRRRIGGYTGDCCGAAFLLCELSFYIVAAAIL